MSPPARRLVWSLNSKPSRVSDYEFHYVRDFQNSRLTRRAPFARVRKRNPFWIPSPKPMCSVTSRAQDKFHSTAEKRSFYLMFELCRVVKKKRKPYTSMLLKYYTIADVVLNVHSFWTSNVIRIFFFQNTIAGNNLNFYQKWIHGV